MPTIKNSKFYLDLLSVFLHFLMLQWRLKAAAQYRSRLLVFSVRLCFQQHFLRFLRKHQIPSIISASYSSACSFWAKLEDLLSSILQLVSQANDRCIEGNRLRNILDRGLFLYSF